MTKEKSELILGVETIRGLVGEPPKRIEIPLELQKSENISVQTWNAYYIAIILYCYKCKEPLIWHTYPREDVLYHCPKCQREWVKDSKWSKGEQK